MKKRFLFIILLILYTAFLIRVMILRDIPTIHLGHLILRFGGADANGEANLVPLRTIGEELSASRGSLIASLNLIGNIALLIPFGILLPLVFRKLTWQKALAFAIVVPLIIEGMQVVLRTGIFDIDDVILNGLGVMVGYWVVRIFVRIGDKKWSGD